MLFSKRCLQSGPNLKKLDYNYVTSCPSVRPSVHPCVCHGLETVNISITVVARRAKFGTQVGCWRPVIVSEFQPAVSNGERVARESLKFFGLRRCPSMLHVFLESDCSLPFLSGFFTDPGHMSRKIRKFRTDKFDT